MRLSKLCETAAFSLGLLFSSCLSSPLSKAPEWVFAPPKPDSTTTYFVGQATSKGGLTEAMGDAEANLVAAIVQYLGVEVRVDTNATAKATLDSYSAELKQSVVTQGSGRLAGFKSSSATSRAKRRGVRPPSTSSRPIRAPIWKGKRLASRRFSRRRPRPSRGPRPRRGPSSIRAGPLTR